MTDKILLTELVKAGGCGSKIGPCELRQALADLPKSSDPRLIYGQGSGDDAGVYKLSDTLALVQTVDFFTPIVDDPYDFGAIAAANALSDCYVLGGTPITVLNLVAFPNSLDKSILKAILAGGADVVSQAGAVVAGGHSVVDTEPKFGLSVTGTVDPRYMITNQNAKPGDVLILTKRIGAGIVTSLWKKQRGEGRALVISPALYKEVVDSMKKLNRIAAEIMYRHKASACTDVTGFGLLGHALNMAQASNVTLEITAEDVPHFAGVKELALEGYKGGGTRNRAWTDEFVSFAANVKEEEKALLNDAQTSGPLLISMPEEQSQAVLAELHKAGIPEAAIAGVVKPLGDKPIAVV